MCVLQLLWMLDREWEYWEEDRSYCGKVKESVDMFGVLMVMIKPSLCFITVMPSPLINAAVTRILLKIVSVRRRILNSEHNCSTFGREENKYVGSWKRMLSLERWNYLRFLKLDDCESPGLPRSKISPRWRVKISCDSDTEWTQREQRRGWTYFR